MPDPRIIAPFPYFGGKARVASLVWLALGDVGHYLEPFFGSGAVLLNRPPWHARKIETVCDADGHVANCWRAIQFAPDEVARSCDWPVNHADLMARKKELNAATADLLARLSSDAEYCDPKLAGYWVWAASCWIGHGLISPKQRPHVGDAGMGVHQTKIPHVGDAGMGVHKTKIPHVGGAGMGVHPRDAYRPEIYGWMRALSERLRGVRVVCGDWSRICGGNWQSKCGVAGVFFDPPYSDLAQRAPGLYSTDSLQVAHDVRAWCIDRGASERYRIVLAGYYEEHAELLDRGWRVHRWSATGGYARLAKDQDSPGRANRHREALFFSPHCLEADADGKWELFP